jgi:hypothetical protein
VSLRVAIGASGTNCPAGTTRLTFNSGVLLYERRPG